MKSKQKSNKKNRPRILMAMSGGVDSSVAALLLKQQGYEVIGAFMKNYTNEDVNLDNCNWVQDRKEAMKIASKLNIPLITLDFETEYRRLIVDEMFRLYRQGITPNPDIDCNNKVKFPLLWRTAKKLGADFIATGHYARIKKVANKKKVNVKNAESVKPIKNYRVVVGASDFAASHWRSKEFDKQGRELDGGLNKYNYEFFRATDESKDQSYFLYRLTQQDLSHTIFPIGELTKSQVRIIAKKNGFENFDRKSTTGICFIGKVNLKKFLQKKIKPKPGKILNPEGRQIGIHDGIFYYTIGQRLGPRFGIDIERGRGKALKRWYVASKDRKTNTIVAAPERHPLLYKKEIIISQPHWINEKPKPGKVHARIRQVGELLPAKLSSYKNKKHYKITLSRAITGISEGQACVMYATKGKKVIGGGVIKF